MVIIAPLAFEVVITVLHPDPGVEDALPGPLLEDVSPLAADPLGVSGIDESGTLFDVGLADCD